MTDSIKTWQTPELVELKCGLIDVMQTAGGSFQDGSFVSTTSGAAVVN
jgi:hypothetical protein